MTQSYKEEQEVWEWIQDKNISKLSQKTGLTKSKLYYFQAGKAQNASFQMIRELQLIKDKDQ
jgi:DNA-binding Xre family transcriptional regulator